MTETNNNNTENLQTLFIVASLASIVIILFLLFQQGKIITDTAQNINILDGFEIVCQHFDDSNVDYKQFANCTDFQPFTTTCQYKNGTTFTVNCKSQILVKELA